MKTAPFIPTKEIIIFPGIITPLYLGREKTIKSLEKALLADNKILLFLQKSNKKEFPDVPADIYEFGVIAKIIQTAKMADNTIKVLVECEGRVKLTEVIEKNSHYAAGYDDVYCEITDALAGEAIRRKVFDAFSRYAKINMKIPPDFIVGLKNIENVNKLLDLIASNINIKIETKQQLLEMTNVEERAFEIVRLINEEVDIMEVEKKIENKVKEQMTSTQKAYYLKEKLKAIKEELGEDDANDNKELREKIKKLKAPDYVKEKLNKELDKLSKMPQFSSEGFVVRNYIEICLELPWETQTEDILNIKKATEILEEDHYGLKDVKERILEFLAVKKLNNKISGSILCFYGPPGVGKTSLVKSIARSMGRKFAKISLGGVRDEAEIRGHRRTYVGSMPGRLVKELKHVGTKNPVMLLDEIDKMTMDFKGDPAAALLEVLDSEQNKEFVDHYLDMPFDLSDVFFIATANDLSTIPTPLRDRMEIITLSSYTEYEKLNIAKRYLITKSREENGLAGYKVKFTDEALLKIINLYTREAGVRNLKREIDKVHRKIAKEILEEEKKTVSVTAKNLTKYLGNPKFKPEKEKEKIVKQGQVNGLAWTATGGTLLEVQSVTLGGKGGLTLTGKLGDVMKESAQVAFTYVKSISGKLGIDEKVYENSSIHLHFPEGAVPKDGPSAGITIATAIISAFTGRKVRQDIAMSGEITITGEVLPVGGIKEKVLGAHRAGVNEVIFPKDNKIDAEELPEEIKADMKFYFVEEYSEVEKLVFEKE